MKKFLIPMALLVLACGQPEQAPEAPADELPVGYVAPEADVHLVVSDSIGVEMGDSNYVFGGIAGAAFLPDGRIAVLDIQKPLISVFSPEGEFQQRVGRSGSGPGEYLLPAGMGFTPGGRLIVSDAMGGKLIWYTADLEYESDLSGFFPAPPVSIVGVEGGAFVGLKTTFRQDEEGMFMGFAVGRWEEGEVEPSIVYHSTLAPFDPTDLSSIGENVVIFGSTPEGIVFTAPMSSEEYTFTAWSPEGDELFTVTDHDFERTPKTQEEIDLETEIVNARMIQQGMPPEMANWEPDPYRIAIYGLFPDGYDRLWVWRATEFTPVFDVYDMEGGKLFTAALDAGERASRWYVVIGRDRFVAFDASPEDYPKLFIGELPI